MHPFRFFLFFLFLLPFSVVCENEQQADLQLSPRQNNTVRYNFGFVYEEEIKDLGWYFQHDLGRRRVQEVFGETYQVRTRTEILATDDEDGLHQLLSSGVYQFLFLCSPKYKDILLKLIDKFPHTTFFLTSDEDLRHPNLVTAFPQMYEAQYLAGYLAGMITQTNKIGLISDSGSPVLLNAFSLGLSRSFSPSRSLHPTTRTLSNELFVFRTVDSSTLPADLTLLTNRLIGLGADVVTFQNQDDPNTVLSTTIEAGVFGIGYHSDMGAVLGDPSIVSSCVWNWTSIYLRMSEEFVTNQWRPRNEWIGLSDFTVSLVFPFSEAVNYSIETTMDGLVQELIFSASDEGSKRQTDGSNYVETVFCGKELLEWYQESELHGDQLCLNQTQIQNMSFVFTSLISQISDYVPEIQFSNLDWSDGLAQWAIALTVINATIILILIIVVIFRDSHPIIILSKQTFLLFLLIGFLFLCVLPLLLIGDMTTRRCDFIFWFMSVADSFILGPLLVKAIMILRLLGKTDEVTFESLHQFEFGKNRLFIFACCALLAIQQLIVLLWIGTDPISVSYTEDKQHEGEYFEYCDIFTTPWFYVDIAYIGILYIVLVVIISRIPRDRVHLFDEIKYISWTLYNMGLIGVVAAVIIIFVSKFKNTLFLIQMVATFLFVFTSIFLIFAPKLYHMLRWDEKEWNERLTEMKKQKNNNLESNVHHTELQHHSQHPTSSENKNNMTTNGQGATGQKEAADPAYRNQIEMEKLDMF